MSKKIVNWPEYNKSLVRRGDITFWFSPDVLSSWEHKNVGCKRGRPYIYSDVAIETLLVVREVFHLTYRSAEGFGQSMFALLRVKNANVPDYTSLCKRSKTLDVAVKVRDKRGPLNVAVDSTGLKVYGEGEWKTRVHGKSKRRTWRKIHVALDVDSGKICASETTENHVDDAEVAPRLLGRISGKIERFFGDSAYDKRKVYRALSTRNVQPIIPPRIDATLDETRSYGIAGKYRNAAIRTMRRCGLDVWKRRVGYHRRSLVENVMFRIKRLFGERLKNRTLANQRTETNIKMLVLNKTTSLGRPSYLS